MIAYDYLATKFFFIYLYYNILLNVQLFQLHLLGFSVLRA